MKTIYKYAIKDRVVMPSNATIKKVAYQNDYLVMWAEVDTDNQLEERYFKTIGTGWGLTYDGGTLTYIDTVFERDFVWHIYEYISNQ